MDRSSFIVLFLFISVCYASKILLIFPVPSKSHDILGNGVLRNLLSAGHEVTYITPFAAKQAEPNVRRIVVKSTFNAFAENHLNISAFMEGRVKIDRYGIFQMLYNVSKIMLEHEEVQKLINDPQEKFDLVIAQIMFNEIYSGFSAVFQCPFIWMLSYEPNFLLFSLIDEETNPAYANDVMFGYASGSTFIRRVQMLYFQIATNIANYFYYRTFEKELYEKAFSAALAKRGRVLPKYEEIRLNASLTLGNTHFSFGTPIRLPQNFIPIGGYHIDTDVKPLPADLQRIMDAAKYGVIYFSMGSNLKSKDFPLEIERSLLEMFGKLKQTVIWKFEATFPNRPENVHILKWAPQQSILAHPNCVLFITHGGLLSTTEVIHFGIPIIGIPVYFDQFNNIDRAAVRGFGKRVDLSYNLAHDLKSAIDEMLNNPKYKDKLKELSFIYHHRLIPPGRELVHWVEHVIATGGALHLRSPALHVPFYQKMYLDLLALIALSIWVAKRFVIFLIATSKRCTQTEKKKN